MPAVARLCSLAAVLQHVVGFKQAVKERDSGDPIAPDAERPSLGPLSRL